MEGSPNSTYICSNGLSRMQKDLRLRTEHTQNGVGSRDMIRAAMSKSRQLSVGVVGAGFAGLRCADVLLQHGARVTIFEARNRLGGRVAQSDHLGHVVDL